MRLVLKAPTCTAQINGDKIEYTVCADTDSFTYAVYRGGRWSLPGTVTINRSGAPDTTLKQFINEDLQYVNEDLNLTFAIPDGSPYERQLRHIPEGNCTSRPSVRLYSGQSLETNRSF